MLFAVTAILSSFMLSGELPAIRGWLRRTVRPAWLEKLQTLGGHVRTTLGGWLRAQLKLMGITFLILNAGLLLLRVRYPVLAALVITVVDALPVFGTGTILIPWALALFLQGRRKPASASSFYTEPRPSADRRLSRVWSESRWG